MKLASLKWGFTQIVKASKSKRYAVPKIANFLLILLQERILKASYVIGYPYYLTVETGNICNLRCPLCPTGQKKDGREAGFMSFDSFRSIIDKLAPYLITLELYNWGEPFLNKDIFKMIHYAHQKGITVHVSSNLNYFNETMAEELTKSNLDLLLVSLDGASQESCSKYQVGINFDKVMGNIRMILEKRGKLPRILWKFIVTKHNEDEIPKAKEMAQRMGIDQLEFVPITCDLAEEVFWDNRSQFENIKEWLPKDEKYSRYDRKRNGKKISRRNFCSFLYARSVIYWNGSVSPCCATWYEKYDFGNVFESGFKNVWNNQKYRASRRVITKGKEGNIRTVCNICKKNGAMY